MLTMDKINQNKFAIIKMNENYAEKKDEIRFKSVKTSHVLLCGTILSLFSMVNADTTFLSGVELSGLSGYMIGCTLPYVFKKVREKEYDFQIGMNNKILSDLEKQKVKILEKRTKIGQKV